VGIANLEGRADQIVDEIDLGARHVHQRHRIDEHLDTVLFDDDVIVAVLGFQIEGILEPGTPASGNADAQGRFLRLLGQNLGDPPRRPVGDHDCVVLRIQHNLLSRRIPNRFRMPS
jgi:hypothetical protein